jgi:predicted nucleic acid-binding protein
LIVPWLQQQIAATSVHVYAEVNEYLLGRPGYFQQRARLRTLLRVIRPYTLTYATLDLYGNLRRQLRPPHGPGLIGDVDTLIAATALDRNLTVITLDTDYERVPGLQVQVLSRTDLL